MRQWENTIGCVKKRTTPYPYFMDNTDVAEETRTIFQIRKFMVDYARR